MKYKFHDENGKYYNSYDLDKVFDKGQCGYVYKIDDDTLLKLFEYGKNDKETFRKIMQMELDNFYKIYQMLYDHDGYFVGYIMKRYDNLDIDILTMPTEYTIDNLVRLNNSVNRLTENGILATDMREANSLCDQKNIIIIDIDQYKVVNQHMERCLLEKNKEYLLHLFSGLYYRSLIIYHSFDNSEIRRDISVINSLFQKENDILDVPKRLVRYKYPIDYIYGVKKNN